MGYGLVIIFGAVVLVLFIVFAIGGKSRPKRTPVAHEAPSRTSPAADEPTPEKSVTATRSEKEAAKAHTPPA